MKRLLPGLLLAPLLWACGVSASPPPIEAGDLLNAPTTLKVGGVPLTAQAQASFSVGGVRVPVQVSGPRGAQTTLPRLTLTGIYVVTEGGVWRGTVTGAAASCQNVLRACLSATGRGVGATLPSGGVQVVVTLRDSQGRTYLLRDEQAKLTR